MVKSKNKSKAILIKSAEKPRAQKNPDTGAHGKVALQEQLPNMVLSPGDNYAISLAYHEIPSTVYSPKCMKLKP
jgi:hypothetical protein